MSLYTTPVVGLRIKPRRVMAEACQCVFGTEDVCAACVRSRFAALRSEIDGLVTIVTDHTGELWDEVMAMRTRITSLETELVREKRMTHELSDEIFRLQSDFNGALIEK